MVHKLGIKFNLIYFISFFILFSAIIISNERMSIIKLTTLSLLILFFQIGIKNFKKTLLIYLFCISVMFFFISSDEQRLRPWKKFIFYLASNIESVTNKNLLISDNKFILLKNNVVFYDYFSLINTGIHISHTYFPLGTGVRNFRHECKSEQYKNKMLFSCGNHPHNVYVEILAEVGFVGLIFFMIFIYIIFKKIIKNKKISRIEKVIMIAMLLSFFWPIATTGSFYNNFYAALVWFNLGVINSLSTSTSDSI